jgi:hypothetical protein
MREKRRRVVRITVALVATCLLSLAAGCGGGGGPAGLAASPATTAAPARTQGLVDPSCVDELGNLIEKLRGLSDLMEQLREFESRLGIDLNFEKYKTNVLDVNAVYERIAFDQLGPACIEAVALPAENAFNAYIQAYNVWKNCIDASSCDDNSIKSELQTQWTYASGFIELAERHLQELSG